MKFNVLDLAQRWIRQSSISPDDGGILGEINLLLVNKGFRVEYFEFGMVKNLYAYHKNLSNSKHVCFVGHVDVVPPGAENLWSVAPFGAEVKNGYLYGRGAVDMKSAIAAFICALFSIEEDELPTVSILLTSDEEGLAVDGLKKMVGVIRDKVPDFFLIGEPTGIKCAGDCIKIGRRGSLTAEIKCFGKQGHIAYPHLFDNPIKSMIDFLCYISSNKFDDGDNFFEPSNLEITSIDVGNNITNIVPAQATARFGIRYNKFHTGKKLQNWLQDIANKYLANYSMEVNLHGDAFFCLDNNIIEIISSAVKKVYKRIPHLSTSGGTSDGRFLYKLAPVVEFGALENTMHQVDERISVKELNNLEKVYFLLLISLKTN